MLCFILFAPILNASAPVLTADSKLTHTGSFQLHWSSKEKTDYILEQSLDEAFQDPKPIYQGPLRARAVSGLQNGAYFFRVKSLGAKEWSAPVSVIVEHYSLKTALLFLFSGAFVFIATALLIIVGHKKHKEKYGEASP